jgi:hypothetical protein
VTRQMVERAVSKRARKERIIGSLLGIASVWVWQSVLIA